jgi:hypothetical protein
MAAGGPAIKAGGPSNLLRKSVPPPPLARRLRFAPAALTAGPPTAVDWSVLDQEDDQHRRYIMAMFQQIGTASDRVMAALSAGLAVEFGERAGAALAQRFLEAEEVDFHWDARIEERWIGAYQCPVDTETELDRVAIFGNLAGRWFVAVCIVDGDGMAHGMCGLRGFGRRSAASKAFATIH